MSLGSSEDAPAAGGDRNYVTLLMVVCLMGAIGIAGTTYESTLQTDPDDVIDVKHTWLPIGKEAIIEFTDPDRPSNQASSGDGAGGEGAGAGGAASAGAGGGGSGGAEEEPPPCTEGFVGLLASLFPMLIPPCGPFYLLGLLLPLIALLAALGLTYRYRERLIALGYAVYGWLIGPSEPGEDGDTVTWPSEQPSNDVHRAWLAMVERANLDQPWTRTPSECARGAVDAGMDSEAVDRVTGLFEEVRYGGAQLNAERRRRAQEWRQRIEERGG